MERKEVNNAFYDELGTTWYESSNHPIALLRAENRARAPWVAQKLVHHFKNPCAVLDVGCGAGFLSNTLAQQGHRLTGIDLSPKSLEVAKAYDQTQTVQYQTADACSLPFKDAQFEAVCAMDLLEHVENPNQVIAESARVLKPGGLLFFHTFNRTWLSWLFAIKGLEWFIPNTPRHIHIYRLFIKPSEMQAHLKTHNLQLSEIHGLMPKIDKSFFQLLLRRGIPTNFSFKTISSLSCGYIGCALKSQKNIEIKEP